ncbi:MAG: class I SAM-dependent methyltransferase [Caulobacter sp.]|nr:class I SAM-dependent methyltransferase [Caulobacter sp.]
MDNVTARVAAQYTAYSYPEAFADLDVRMKAGHVDFGDPAYFGPMFWPEGRSTPPRILVAGCGTVQASVIAYSNPDSQVVGIDISDASLGHQRYLRETFGLKNLELYQGDLRDVGKIGGTFDLIVSTGVLHHMADPASGLSALKSVLSPDGAMFIMLYASIGRAGVYLVQDALRRMGVSQTPEDVAFVRALLDKLPPGHPVQWYRSCATDLSYDAGIVDTFLHPQDRAYDVSQIMDWVKGVGLGFQSWMENARYEPYAHLPDIASRLEALPDEDRWAAVEALLGTAMRHMFILRHPDRVHRVSFEGDDYLAYRPRAFPDASVGVQDGQRLIIRGSAGFPVSEAETLVFPWCDGSRTIAAMEADPVLAGYDPAERRAFLKEHFQRMWRVGLMMFQR